jgi:hypothetical protein
MKNNFLEERITEEELRRMDMDDKMEILRKALCSKFRSLLEDPDSSRSMTQNLGGPATPPRADRTCHFFTNQNLRDKSCWFESVADLVVLSYGYPISCWFESVADLVVLSYGYLIYLA